MNIFHNLDPNGFVKSWYFFASPKIRSIKMLKCSLLPLNWIHIVLKGASTFCQLLDVEHEHAKVMCAPSELDSNCFINTNGIH